MKKAAKRKGHGLRDVPGLVREGMETIPPLYPQKPGYLKVLLDVLYCYLAYGAGAEDYFLYRFYALSRCGRKSYITKRDKTRLYRYANDPQFRSRVSRKDEFLRYYGHLMGREVMTVTDESADGELLAFVSKLRENGTRRMICKPFDADSGMGIFLLDLDDPALTSVSALMDRFDREIEKVMEKYPLRKKTDIARHIVMVEAVIENHPDLARLNPSSLNTMRIPVLFYDGEYHITGAYLRLGRDNMVVDNYSSGGILTEIDLETGVVATEGIDKEYKRYVIHPTTGVPILGARIPYWKEVKELVLKASQVTPQLHSVGWDVAVTPNGPVIIEGNTSCAFTGLQITRNQGMRHLYKKVLDEIGRR